VGRDGAHDRGEKTVFGPLFISQRSDLFTKTGSGQTYISVGVAHHKEHRLFIQDKRFQELQKYEELGEEIALGNVFAGFTDAMLAVRERLLLGAIFRSKRSLYQDRLGTNAGEKLRRKCVFLQDSAKNGRYFAPTFKVVRHKRGEYMKQRVSSW
jgi:hypothetical protein